MTRNFFTNMIILSLLGLVVAAQANTITADTDTIMAQVKQRAEEVAAQAKMLTYVADSKTEVKKKDGKLERLVESRRKVTYTPPGKVAMIFESIRIDGRDLDQEEMNKELKKSRREDGLSPFVLSELSKYAFTVLGEKIFEDLPVWEIAFKPLQPAKGLTIGTAYLDQATYDAVWMTFSPAKPPGMVKEMKAEMFYQKVNDFWVPSRFTMHMRINVTFIFTLADKLIDIEENYSEHKITFH